MSEKPASSQPNPRTNTAADFAFLGFTKAFDLSANSIIITDAQGIIVYANPHFYEVTGFSPQEVLGQNPRIIKHEGSTIDYAQMWETIRRGNVWKGEFVNRKRSGELFWEKGTISPLKDYQGNITHFLAIKEDITLLKESEKLLQKASNFYFNMLEEFPEMVWKCDSNGKFDFFNKTLIEFAGLASIAENYDQAFRAAVHPEDFPRLKSNLDDHLIALSEFRIDLRLLGRDGEYRWMHNHGKPFYDISGNFNGIICACTDIHDRKIAEERLLKSENEYHRMFEDSPLGIFQLDRQFILIKANRAFARFFGFSDARIAISFLNTMPESFIPTISLTKSMYKHMLVAKSLSSAFEAEFKDASGIVRYARIFFRKVPNGNNKRKFLIDGILEDATQQKRAEMKLKTSEAKFRNLFDNAFDAIMILDELKIVDYNKRFLNLFGQKRIRPKGVGFEQLCPQLQNNGQSSRELLQSKIRETLNGMPQVFGLLMLRKGTEFDAEVSFTSILVENQMMVQAIVRDVSERIKAEKQIRQSRDTAERARNAQTEFLSMMSHEIRTPLNAVVSLTDLMLHENPRPDQLQNMQSVNISANHLLGLIDDILDYNKIESGNIQFEEVNFNIRELVDQALNTFEMKAQEKKLMLLGSVHKDVPEFMIGDSLRIKQVLLNLLSNALKFTEQGSVITTVHKLKSPTGNEFIKFCIKDTGIGIKLELQEKIFERFSQADISTSRKYGGSGLGLSICKRLVDLQKGTIYVSSKPGKGSEFCFCLPLRIGRHEPVGPKKTESIETTVDLSGLRILMVEDDKMNQFVGKQILQGKGKAMLDIASNGNEALELLKSCCYDLVLTDLLLPDLDGFELTRLIRTNPDGQICNSKLPIIALTADAFTETRNKAFDAGVDDFITKPVDFLKLLGSISRLTKP